jgi:hypothetical protein
VTRMSIPHGLTAIGIFIIAIGAPDDNAQAKQRLTAQWERSSTLPNVTLSATTGKPVKVLKVVDLPNVAEFQRDDGSYVDLGWRFVGTTGGEWVGYIGTESDYLTVSPEQLTAIMQIAGLESLPEPPASVLQSTNPEGLFADPDTEASLSGLFLLILVPLFVVLDAGLRSGPGENDIFDPNERPLYIETPPKADWLTTAELKIATAAAAQDSPSGTQPKFSSRA